MCSLFGLIDYRGVLKAHEKNCILSVLSRECEIRGTDATGIAYNTGNKIHVYKKPVAAHKMRFQIPGYVKVVMGHTRMTTQGSAKLNYNNHPWATRNFALAHNGVLWNDQLLRETEKLPQTQIETDSYIAVQLLEKKKPLNFQTIGWMAEQVQGSFTFTILDRKDSIYFVRGDNPLVVFCYDGFYIYASTAEILYKMEQRLGLCHQDFINLSEGDILRIDRNGECSWEHFHPANIYSCRYPYYWDYVENEIPVAQDYLMDTARTMGAPSEDVQTMLHYGCCADEIEELLYEPKVLHDIAMAIRHDLRET